MRQAVGAFKFSPRFRGRCAVRVLGGIDLRPVLAAALLVLSPGCATFGGKADRAAAAERAEALRLAQEQSLALETEVANLKSENARLQAKIAEFERKTVAANAAAEIKPAGELKDSPAPPVLAVRNAPSTAPADPIVSAPNADNRLPPAPAPVAEAPRLVQPTFASTDQIFENEADSASIKLSSVLWGVHLASYRHAEEASAGWKQLQRQNPDELGLLEPRIEKVTIEGKGEYLRLVGGGFSSRQKAAALCDTLAAKGLYCRVANFGGERLSVADNGGAR